MASHPSLERCATKNFTPAGPKLDSDASLRSWRLSGSCQICAVTSVRRGTGLWQKLETWVYGVGVAEGSLTTHSEAFPGHMRVSLWGGSAVCDLGVQRQRNLTFQYGSVDCKTKMGCSCPTASEVGLGRKQWGYLPVDICATRGYGESVSLISSIQTPKTFQIWSKKIPLKFFDSNIYVCVCVSNIHIDIYT